MFSKTIENFEKVKAFLKSLYNIAHFRVFTVSKNKYSSRYWLTFEDIYNEQRNERCFYTLFTVYYFLERVFKVIKAQDTEV